MINIVLPGEHETLYGVVDGALVGPVAASAIPGMNVIHYRDPFDVLEQSEGIYGENHVSHRQTDAAIHFDALAADIRPAPTVTYPQRIYVDCRFNGSTKTQAADHGRVVSGRVTMRNTSTIILQRLWSIHSPYNFSYKEVQVNTSSPTIIRAVREREFEFEGMYESIYLNYIARTITYDDGFASVDYPEDTNWSIKQSSEVFHTLVRPEKSVVGQWARAGLINGLSSLSNVVASPSRAVTLIRNAVSDQLFPASLEAGKDEHLKHYGDLAMSASQEANANNVNMLAFIRDLRRPWELIPKLRNLRNLKGVADNYLTVNYGVLPTISDVQHIIGAIKRLSPYLDKNGFSTYGAGNTTHFYHGDVSVKSLQRLKLAVDIEDVGLLALVQRFESMGFLPTFQNIWDLIPYSFVIDWLIDVGGFFERVDTRLRLLRLNVRYVTMSHKTECNLELEATRSSPYAGSIRLVQYHRWVSDRCPVPPLSVESTFQDFNHWLESSALIIQRVKAKR